MPTEMVLPGVSWPSGTPYDFTDLDLAVMNTPGVRHYLNADNAETDGSVLSMRCKVQNILIQSTGTAPVLNTAINSQPSITHGTAGAGILLQSMRAVNSSQLHFGADGHTAGNAVDKFSFMSIVRVTRDLASAGIGNQTLFIGNVTGAGITSGDRSPVIRFADTSGSLENIPQFLTNALGIREFYNGLEFRTTNRVLLVTFSTANGWHWYVDDYSAAKKASVLNTESLTDGRFCIGTIGAGNTSLNYCGSWAAMSVFDEDLFEYSTERRLLMQAAGNYIGITST